MVNSVINRYAIKNILKTDWTGENFSIYDYDDLTFPSVLQGSTGIGSYPDDYEREIEEVVRWCYCLSEIRSIVKNATWKVTFGDELVEYNDKIGFHLKNIPRSLHEELKPDV